MGVNDKAQQQEKAAYKKVKAKLGNAEAFAQPAGFETSFPDFGFRLKLDKKAVDIHIEYKADAKAQMGSMRDWIFDGSSNKFKTASEDEGKKDLISLMNESDDAVNNGKRLLKDFKKYFDKKINKIYSGMLTIESDKKVRKAKLKIFASNTDNYQLAKIDDKKMGDMIISHYKKKFKKELRSDADYSVLYMMIDNELFFVEDTSGSTPKLQKELHDLLGVTKVPKLDGLKAKLEVRIQPRGLSSPDKPGSIDVMASFRLSGKPTGVKI